MTTARVSLRTSLATTKAMAGLIGKEQPIGKVVGAMNELLWSMSEDSPSPRALIRLDEALALFDPTRKTSSLEVLVYHLATSFSMVASGNQIKVVPRNSLGILGELLGGDSTDGSQSGVSNHNNRETVYVKVEPEDPMDVAFESALFGAPSTFERKDANAPHELPTTASGRIRRSTRDADEDDFIFETASSSVFEDDDDLDYRKPRGAGPPSSKRKRGTPAAARHSRASRVSNIDHCPFCNYSFAPGITNAGIFSHIFSAHKDISGTFFRCLKCDQKFVSMTHETNCDGDFIFEYDATSVTKKKNVLRIELQNEACPFCATALAKKGEGVTLSSLGGHILKNHRELRGTFFRCSQCPSERWRNRADMSRHINAGVCTGSVEFFHDISRKPKEEGEMRGRGGEEGGEEGGEGAVDDGNDTLDGTIGFIDENLVDNQSEDPLFDFAGLG